MRNKALVAGIVALAGSTVAIGGFGLLAAGPAGAGGYEAKAELVDPTGAQVGTVTFDGRDGYTDVRVKLDASVAGIDGVALDAFHGFHIHANDDPMNGEGCEADPSEPANTWFTSVDGHWKDDGQTHADHRGDLPSVLVLEDGSATARFRTDRFDPAELAGRAVILHAGEDNFGNVPVGDAPNQYTPNSDEALTATANTGNAGNRIACGVVELRS